MIIKEFELKLASRWGEYLLFETLEAARKPRTNPVSVAFRILENAADVVTYGEVIVDGGLEQYWRVLEKEYSVSRMAVNALMILARKYPSVEKVKDDGKTRNLDSRLFEKCLEELTRAGVLDSTRKDDGIEYELSHDLLSSVVFEKNFAEMWKKTRLARLKRKNNSFPYDIEKHVGELFDQMDDDKSFE